MKTLLMTVAAAMMIAGGAQALTVDESSVAGGDFSGNGSQDAGNTIGTLDTGLNSVTGSLAGECLPSGNTFTCFNGIDPQDDIFFTVGAGTELVGIDANIEGGGASDLLFSVFMRTNNGGSESNLIQGSAGDLPVNTMQTYLPPLGTLGEGSYRFAVFLISASEAGDVDGFYNVNFNVQEVQTPAVPLPATLPLLLAGMGALGIARRRRG